MTDVADDNLGVWERNTFEGFLKGINIAKNTDVLDTGELLQAKNVFYKKEYVYADSGYKAFGGVTVGEPQVTFQFFKTNGTDEHVLVTTKAFYRWGATDAWELVPDNTTATTLSANALAGATSVTVTSATGLVVGRPVSIELNSGAKFTTLIQSIVGTTIGILPALPSAANSTKQFYQGRLLAGTTDEHVVIVTVPANNWLVFTNGVDAPWRYNGTELSALPGTPGSTFSCKTLCVFNNALWLGNVVLDGTAYPQRVYYSKVGDVTVYAVGIGLTSGYLELQNSEDFVLQLLPLGPYLIIYRERSIIRVDYVGSQSKMYAANEMIYGEGAASTRAVIDLGDFHLLAGRANIYEYRGGFDLVPVADNLFYMLYSVDADVNVTTRRLLFSLYVEELDECWFFYPTTGQELPNRLIRYSIEMQRFTIREFAHSFVGYGYFSRTLSLTWDSLVGSWEEQTWKWNSVAIQSGSPSTLLCCPADKMVYEYDYTSIDDAGTPISYLLETKDFVDPPFETRFDQMGMQVSASNLLVEYSTDRGQSWNQLGTVSNGVVLSRERLHKQFVGNTVRFRFSGTGPLRLGWLYMMTCRESEV